MAQRGLPETGLADLARVAHALQPDSAVLAAAAELLGLARPVRPAASAVARAEPGHPAAHPGTPPGPPSERGTGPGSGGGAPVPVSADYRPPSTQLLPDEPAETLADLLPEGGNPRPPQGLLPPRRARALLSHLASRMRPDGDFDGARAVDLLAHGEPVLELPRLWIETTRGGTELVLDIGLGMQPFRSDLDKLPGQMSLVVGRENMQTLWFEECPAGGRGVYVAGRLEPVRYRLPPAGTLIVAVTTFGVCGGSPATSSVIDRWHRFVAAAKRARTPLIALTPLPDGRRPPDLPRQLASVTWDRTSKVHGVTDAVRSRAHSRPGPISGAG